MRNSNSPRHLIVFWRSHELFERFVTEVIVQWGDHDGRIKNVRTTVARFPYLTEGRNSDLNATTIK